MFLMFLKHSVQLEPQNNPVRWVGPSLGPCVTEESARHADVGLLVQSHSLADAEWRCHSWLLALQVHSLFS